MEGALGPRTRRTRRRRIKGRARKVTSEIGWRKAGRELSEHRARRRESTIGPIANAEKGRGRSWSRP
eukprot:10748037-Heterocapsa_arctica.AAC.1